MWGLLLAFHAFSGPLTTGNPFARVDPYGINPSLRWQTRISDHFLVTYPDSIESLAPRIANYLEEAHLLLTQSLGWTPAKRTRILLLDNSDAANGLTSAIAGFGIILWMVPPDNASGIGNYDQYLRLLALHEYTHFVNMDTTSPLFDSMRTIFGDLILPNSYLPPWMLEGIAVVNETAFSLGGRGRSTYYHAIERQMVHEHAFEHDAVTLDMLGPPSMPSFPFGDLHYIFGYFLMRDMGDLDHLKSWNLFSSGQMPFLIGRNYHLFQNESLDTLWERYTKNAIKRTQEDDVKLGPVTEVREFFVNNRAESIVIQGARVSPNGAWIAWNQTSGHKRNALMLAPIIKKEPLELGAPIWINDKASGTSLAFTPDSNYVICSELRRTNLFDTYSDLEIIDIKTHQRTWLTENERAKDPDVDPSGKFVIFVHTELGQASIARATLHGTSISNIENIYSPGLLSQAMNPRLSLDGRRLVFAVHKDQAIQSDIYELTLDKDGRPVGDASVVIADGSLNETPQILKNGDILTISNKNGAHNLYRYHNGVTQRVTTIAGSICYPQIVPDSDEILVSHLHSYGWNLGVLKMRNDLSDSHLEPLPILQAPFTSTKTYPSIRTDYSPDLIPRAYGPLLMADAKGVTFGGEFISFDQLNTRNIFAGAAYNTGTRFFDVTGSSQMRLGNYALLGSANLMTLGSDTAIDRLGTLSLTTSRSWLSMYHSLNLATTVNVQRQWRYAPQTLVAQTALTSSFDLTAVFNSSEVSNYAVTTEAGSFAFLGIRQFIGSATGQKFMGLLQHPFRLMQHLILAPTLKGSFVSQPTQNPLTMVQVQGRSPQSVLNSLTPDSLNILGIRGYPGILFTSSFAGILSWNLSLPLLPVFRGSSGVPFFIQNLSAFTFLDIGYMDNLFLPSTGGGIRLDTQILTIPVSASTECHYGGGYAGQLDVFFQLVTQGLSF